EEIKYNFYFSSREIVSGLNRDLPSYSRIILNGKITNYTETAPLSKFKKLKMLLTPDNYLIKIEKFIKAPEMNNFVKLPTDLQPKERFVYVHGGIITYFQIKYSEFARQYQIKISFLTNMPPF
ncbi:unnamed protein product, partial [marine sediment metagenome]